MDEREHLNRVLNREDRTEAAQPRDDATDDCTDDTLLFDEPQEPEKPEEQRPTARERRFMRRHNLWDPYEPPSQEQARVIITNYVAQRPKNLRRLRLPW